MNKRKIADCVSDTNYHVIETKDKNGQLYVQFVPASWVKPVTPNVAIVARTIANCYFPRKLPGQSKHAHQIFVKNAIFVCMEPKEDGKWELMSCRVLKMGIDTIDDAIGAQKMFSDFFDTTEAEMEMQRSVQTKRVRKTKKLPPKMMQRKTIRDDSSDSEREQETSGLAEVVIDYNAAFIATQSNSEKAVEIEMPALAEGTILHATQSNSEQAVAIEVPVLVEGTILQFVDQNLDAGLAETAEDFEVPVVQVHDEHFEVHSEQVDVHLTKSENGCKCMDKMRNKVDYFQKKVMSEIADFRQETRNSISKLAEMAHRALNNGQSNQDDLEEVATISDELAEKYKEVFPVDDKVALREVNRKIKNDPDFKTYVESKLDKITGKDSTTTARKILNSLCTVKCFSQFTWLGTKEKERFSDMESLIEVITKLLEKRFSERQAYALIETVFKQRAKSAGEAKKEPKAPQINQAVSNVSVTAEQPTEGSGIQCSNENLFDDNDAPFDAERFINLMNF